MVTNTKLHWHCFAFSGKTLQDEDCFSTTYMGYHDKEITLPRIEEAKSAAKINQEAVLLYVSYLGYMTKEEFTVNE